MGTNDNSSNVTADFLDSVFQDNSEPEVTAYSKFLARFSLSLSLLLSLQVVIAAVSLLVSYIVLEALRVVPATVLRSKYLICNALVVDSLLCVLKAFDSIPFIWDSFGYEDDDVHNCFAAFHLVIMNLLVYQQCMSSTVLACDRLYAVTYPIKYRINGYSKITMGLIIALGVSGIPVCLILYPAITPFVSDTNGSDEPFCSKLLGEFQSGGWNSRIRPVVQLGVGILTFGVYVIIFILVKRQRLDSKSGETGKIISLAATYFFVHVSRFCLYLPGPVFAGLRNSGIIKLPRPMFAALNQILICVYLLNAILDPYIFASRIPSIQENLPFSLKLKSGKASRRSGTNGH